MGFQDLRLFWDFYRDRSRTCGCSGFSDCSGVFIEIILGLAVVLGKGNSSCSFNFLTEIFCFWWLKIFNQSSYVLSQVCDQKSFGRFLNVGNAENFTILRKRAIGLLGQGWGCYSCTRFDVIVMLIVILIVKFAEDFTIVHPQRTINLSHRSRKRSPTIQLVGPFSYPPPPCSHRGCRGRHWDFFFLRIFFRGICFQKSVTHCFSLSILILGIIVSVCSDLCQS
jgi:hypothetical protein